MHVRMVENLTPEQVTDIGSLASCECSGNPRFIINLVVPSFCSSSCVRDLTCRVGTAPLHSTLLTPFLHATIIISLSPSSQLSRRRRWTSFSTATSCRC